MILSKIKVDSPPEDMEDIQNNIVISIKNILSLCLIIPPNMAIKHPQNFSPVFFFSPWGIGDR